MTTPVLSISHILYIYLYISLDVVFAWKQHQIVMQTNTCIVNSVNKEREIRNTLKQLLRYSCWLKNQWFFWRTALQRAVWLFRTNKGLTHQQLSLNKTKEKTAVDCSVESTVVGVRWVWTLEQGHFCKFYYFLLWTTCNCLSC